MLMYIDPAEVDKYYDDFVCRMNEFMDAIRNPEILTECVTVSRCCLQRDYYKALLSCQKLIAYEDMRLRNDPAGVSADSD